MLTLIEMDRVTSVTDNLYLMSMTNQHRNLLYSYKANFVYTTIQSVRDQLSTVHSDKHIRDHWLCNHIMIIIIMGYNICNKELDHYNNKKPDSTNG